MCVCVCVYARVCVRVCVYAHTHTRTCTQTHACTDREVYIEYKSLNCKYVSPYHRYQLHYQHNNPTSNGPCYTLMYICMFIYVYIFM